MTDSLAAKQIRLPPNAFDVPEAWRGSALAPADFVVNASDALATELEAAARAVLASGKRTEALTASDCAASILVGTSETRSDTRACPA